MESNREKGWRGILIQFAYLWRNNSFVCYSVLPKLSGISQKMEGGWIIFQRLSFVIFCLIPIGGGFSGGKFFRSEFLRAWNYWHMFCSLSDEVASCFPGDDQLLVLEWKLKVVVSELGGFRTAGTLPGYSPRWPCAQLFLWQTWSKCSDDKIVHVLFFPTHYLFSAVAKSCIPTAGWELVDDKG